MRRSIKVAAGLALALVVLLVIGPEVLLIPLTLAFGWIKSLSRLSSVVHLDTGTVVWLVVAIALLLVGTHSFFCWVQRNRSAAGRPWRWRWTCGVYAGLVLVLFASAGLVGAAHQTGWMISSPEPIFKRRGASLRERQHLYEVGHEVLLMARSTKWDFPRLKQELARRGPQSLWEDFGFYFVPESTDTPGYVILLPRNPKHQTEIGIVERETFHTRPFRDFADLLTQGVHEAQR